MSTSTNLTDTFLALLTGLPLTIAFLYDHSCQVYKRIQWCHSLVTQTVDQNRLEKLLNSGNALHKRLRDITHKHQELACALSIFYVNLHHLDQYQVNLPSINRVISLLHTRRFPASEGTFAVFLTKFQVKYLANDTRALLLVNLH